MAGTFSYKNRKGQTEQRPMEPSFFQKAYENAAYPGAGEAGDIDKARAEAKQAAASKGSYSEVPDSMQKDKE